MRAGIKRKRLTSRHNRLKRARALKLFAILALCCLLGGGTYYLLRSSIFELREVDFYGNRHLSEQDMINILGIRAGLNMFSLSSEELSEKLLGSPWIRDARLRKEFPGRLLVKVEEASPCAILKDRSGLFLVDRRGRELEKLRGEPVYFLPVIVDTSGERAGAYRDALALASVMNKDGFAARTGPVEIRDFHKGAETMTVTIDGLRARIGKGRYREKLEKLFELKDEIGKKGINVDYVDLRFNGRVVVKPVNAVAKVERTEEAYGR